VGRCARWTTGASGPGAGPEPTAAGGGARRSGGAEPGPARAAACCPGVSDRIELFTECVLVPLDAHKAGLVQNMLGSVPKKAYNSIRCRAYQDIDRLFDQKSMHLSSKQILIMLTEDRLESYVKYCLIPKDPTQPLDIDNSVIVTNIQRSYVVAGWKAMHDSAKYSSDLEFILSTQNTHKI
jgi:hypothetical protein